MGVAGIINSVLSFFPRARAFTALRPTEPPTQHTEKPFFDDDDDDDDTEGTSCTN